MKMVSSDIVRNEKKNKYDDVDKIIGKNEKLKYYEENEKEWKFCENVKSDEGKKLNDCDGWEYSENKLNIWNSDILIMCNDNDMKNKIEKGEEGIKEEMEDDMRCE